MTPPRPRSGWDSSLPDFTYATPGAIRDRLQGFVRDASPEQIRAWTDSIPPLQSEAREVMARDRLSHTYSTILEYELPLESRRPDVILLVGNGVLVLELKGKAEPSQADVDQAAAYARDLRDAQQVALKHPDHAGVPKSEPEHFIDFADRIPDWCVVVGLIGSGQEIHVGEEGGVGQWRVAVEGSRARDAWTMHTPLAVYDEFKDSRVPVRLQPALNLDQELRFHAARDLHRFVERLLKGEAAADLRPIADRLDAEAFHLRITRSLDEAKAYLRERYADDPDARFGIVASSKDRDLERFGIPNDFPSTKRVRVGPWYAEDEHGYGGRSCRRLDTCVTEFGCQGLELDATLLAWGTDLTRQEGRWSNARARGYRRGAAIRDPFQLRLNAYRVLLTRGRDACVIFVPPLAELDETAAYLVESGCRTL
jgi:hypothetical protein